MGALVQPIVLPLDAKQYPLVQVITVAATASASALAECDRADPAWSTWLAGRFTKSVRVAKTRAAFVAALDSAVYVATVGELSAAAFAPMAYAEMPKWMSQARVEGLHCAGELADGPGRGEWAIGVVAQMSAGKAAAQVAHALCRIVLDTGSVPSFSVYRARADAHGVVEIVDAGLTEFGGVPTRTVVASPR
jgi:hypothetical protein